MAGYSMDFLGLEGSKLPTCKTPGLGGSDSEVFFGSRASGESF